MSAPCKRDTADQGIAPLHAHLAMKSREEQLEAWRAKRAKPLGNISHTNILNRPPKAPAKRTAKDLNSARSKVGTGVVDKENQPDQPCEKALKTSSGQSTRIPRAKAAGSDALQSAEPSSAPPVVQQGRSEATPARRTSISACTLEHMENQYDMLKGTLDTLKRESIRSAAYLVTLLKAMHICTCTKQAGTAHTLNHSSAGPASAAM